MQHIEDGLDAVANGGSQPATLPNWYRKLGSDPANCKICFLGDSTSYEPNDQRLFSRFRPNVTTTNGAHTLPTGTITVASTSGAPTPSGTMTVAARASPTRARRQRRSPAARAAPA
jgi:hypothetical protein